MRTGVVALVWAVAGTGAAVAQTPSYDFDFATIGSPWECGVAGDGPVRHRNSDRARAGGLHVPDFKVRSDHRAVDGVPEHFRNPTGGAGAASFVWGPAISWGGVADPTYSGTGRRYVLDQSIPNAANVPVSGLNWRDAAYYCNWLSNGKPAQWAAIQDGAYDASTFANLPGGGFSDQRAHNPGATFWIPTQDEWRSEERRVGKEWRS